MKNKGMSSYKQHNKNTQPAFSWYVAVKLYSSGLLKTLVNWLYFCVGISSIQTFAHTSQGHLKLNDNPV